ncbi:MAG TPA: SusC/RagA family TonB-linked outer membrane protein [Puia sp.]
MTISTAAYSQMITLHEKQASLPSIFDKIRQQTGYDFLVTKNIVKDIRPISIELEKVPLKSALEKVFAGLPLEFEIFDKSILVRKKKPAAAGSDQTTATTGEDPIVVRGRVMDTTGTGLGQASIDVSGEKRRKYITNARGEFEISLIQPGDTIHVSYVGYIDKNVVYTKNNNYIYIRLAISQSVLDQTVVQAYGTTSRRYSIGDISTVTAEDIAKQPVSNVALALQGRVPGLLVTPLGGGVPGAAIHLQVRGQNTVNPNQGSSRTNTNLLYNQPLILVDGIPTAMQNNTPTQLLNSFVAGAGSAGLSPINGINPADIESISILKDADATSIYGSQGANGVIIITTKRGKSGKTQFNINVNTGPNSPVENLKMLHTQPYLQLRRTALALDSINLATAPSYVQSSFPDVLNFDTTKYTDFVKKFFNGNPMNTDVHASISGGSGSDSYILSGGYTRSAYNLPGNFADNRLSFHSGAHHTSLDRKFNLDFGADLSYDKNNSAVTATAAGAMGLPPDYPDFFTPSGALAWNYNGFALNQIFATLRQPYSIEQFSTNINIKADYEIIPGLRASVLAGYSRADNKEYSAMPRSAQDPSSNSINATADFSSSIGQSIDIEPQLNYRKYIGKGVLTVLAGGTYTRKASSSTEQDGSGYPDDALLQTIQAARTVMAYDNSSIYKYVAGFGRINYIHDGKYIINLTGRRDGSSNFGPNHQFGNFGSAGLGWIFSEEKGFKNALPFISFGKLSGDYGTNGTDGVAAYMFQPFYKIFNSNPTTFQGSIPFIPNNLDNPNYTWASKHAINVHIDLGFLKDRILLGASWYQNRTGNQLTASPLSSITGFSSVVENMNANVQNRGVEFTLSTKNIQTKDFTWTSTFNISANRNKLISFPGLDHSAYSGTYEIGKPVTLLYGFKYAGLNPTNGVYQFYKGNGKSLANLLAYDSTALNYTPLSKGGDEVVLGNSEPAFYGGLGNSFTYKGISLSMFFQFSKAYAANYQSAVYSIGVPGSMTNFPAFIQDQLWTSPNDKNAVLERPTTVNGSTKTAQAASKAEGYFIASSGAYSDDFYVRLKTLSISYSLPRKWVKTMHMTNFNVYINAQNVLTFTNYKYGDPEMPGQMVGIPTQRIIAGGLSVSF